jgi:N-ethylmaleimide reductase
LRIVYLHTFDPPSGADHLAPHLRTLFKGTVIVNGGYDEASGNAAIASGEADLVAYGVPFLANPDLPYRFGRKAALNAPDQATFYAGEDKGYTDYPALVE